MPGQLCTPRSLFNTPRAKRKRSPQPSVNSSTAENDCPYPARMANDNDDFKMWGSEIVKIFLEILVDEIKKEGPSMSKKDRSFFPRQWQTIDDKMTKKVGKNYGQKKLKGKFARLKANYTEFVALKNHTGLGWDPITQTVTAPYDVWENYVQAHPNAKQFQTKGLGHYELMSEIFAKSFATGAFARSSRQGASTSDDEREMDERFHAYTSGKGVVDESCTSGSKRKSSGQGQSSKNPKMDDALQSWQRSCEARERCYLQAEANAGAADVYSVAACMTILKSMMSSSRPNGRQPNNMYDPYSDDDDDVMDLHMVCQLTRDIPTRQPQRNCPYTGEQYIKFLLSGNPKSIREQLRMEVPTFVELVRQIVRRNVVDWSNMRLSLEESLAMFLFICGQSLGTRNAGDQFQHSNETIHRHFVLMMRALGNLAPFVIQPPNMDVTHHKIRNDRWYWPWFKNKYYLVDAGYTHMRGYVAPYRGQKYHLQEFNRRRRYHGPQELFNHRHSSLRNVIERTFGVLKQRFPLLRHMPRYDMVRQGPIVMACYVLHNWIRTVQEQDEFFDAEESSNEDEDDVEDKDEDEDEGEDGGEGASQVQGEVGVQNVHGNEDGVPAMQQHNHVNMSREQLVLRGLDEERECLRSIAEVKLVMDEKAKRSKGYAFIQYTSQDDALLALESMDHKYFDGRVIFVELAKPGHNAFGVYSKTTGPPQEQNIANQDEAMEGAGVSLFRFLFGLQSLQQ
ncbi:unnamed protein product [Camellia sinensis]